MYFGIKWNESRLNIEVRQVKVIIKVGYYSAWRKDLSDPGWIKDGPKRVTLFSFRTIHPADHYIVIGHIQANIHFNFP
jgi:hypothetical protein